MHALFWAVAILAAVLVVVASVVLAVVVVLVREAFAQLRALNRDRDEMRKLRGPPRD